MKILLDLKAKQQLYSSNGHKISFSRALLTDGTLASILFRLQSASSSARLSALAYFFHILNKIINGCVIGIGARFDGGFVLIHPIGVVINSAVRGGSNIMIESGVVIGDNHGNSPLLGNNIFIGSGAKIIGGVRIGDHSNIGANAVVLNDVQDFSTAVGIPAKSFPSRSRAE
jgi:serine O-acetyltransferase